MPRGKKKDDLESGSDMVKEVHCAACKDEGDHRSAVKYCIDCNQSICQQCVDFHRRVKQIKDHKLVDQHDTEAVKCAQLLALSLNCPNHQDKRTELMCKDHDVMCCLTCATVKHRNCKQVYEVGECAAKLDKTTETQAYLKHLEAAKLYMEEVVKLKDKHKKELKSQLDKALPMSIQELKRKVNKVLTNLEQNIISKGKRLVSKEMVEYESEVQTWNQYIKSVKDQTKLLDAVRQNGSDIHFFIALETIQKNLAEIDQNILSQGTSMEVASGILFTEGNNLRCLYDGTRKLSDLADVTIRNAIEQLPSYEFGIPNPQIDSKSPRGLDHNVRIETIKSSSNEDNSYQKKTDDTLQMSTPISIEAALPTSYWEHCKETNSKEQHRTVALAKYGEYQSKDNDKSEFEYHIYRTDDQCEGEKCDESLFSGKSDYAYDTCKKTDQYEDKKNDDARQAKDCEKSEYAYDTCMKIDQYEEKETYVARQAKDSEKSEHAHGTCMKIDQYEEKETYDACRSKHSGKSEYTYDTCIKTNPCEGVEKYDARKTKDSEKSEYKYDSCMKTVQCEISYGVDACDYKREQQHQDITLDGRKSDECDSKYNRTAYMTANKYELTEETAKPFSKNTPSWRAWTAANSRNRKQ